MRNTPTPYRWARAHQKDKNEGRGPRTDAPGKLPLTRQKGEDGSLAPFHQPHIPPLHPKGGIPSLRHPPACTPSPHSLTLSLEHLISPKAPSGPSSPP